MFLLLKLPFCSQWVRSAVYFELDLEKRTTTTSVIKRMKMEKRKPNTASTASSATKVGQRRLNTVWTVAGWTAVYAVNCLQIGPKRAFSRSGFSSSKLSSQQTQESLNYLWWGALERIALLWRCLNALFKALLTDDRRASQYQLQAVWQPGAEGRGPGASDLTAACSRQVHPKTKRSFCAGGPELNSVKNKAGNRLGK